MSKCVIVPVFLFSLSYTCVQSTGQIDHRAVHC